MLDTMTIEKALELLRSWGCLSPRTPHSYPSIREEEAYNLLLNADQTLFQDDFFIHEPSKKIMLVPKVGMGVTLHYPSDCHPFEVTKIISPQTLEIRGMTATPVPGWEPDFHPGGFFGHTSNLHDRKYTYTSDPTGQVMRIRLNKKGRWMNRSLPFSVGHARYFIDWND